MFGPREHGGSAAPLPITRQVFEALAGACGVTYFVWVQHHAPVRLLPATDNTVLRERHLQRLCTGADFGGVAFGYLRRPGPSAVSATAVRGGFRIQGEAPWVTSWGIADVIVVGARVGGDVLLFAVVGQAINTVRPSSPIDLAVMNASATVSIVFDDYFVPEEDVVSVLPFTRWQVDDVLATAKPSPAPFGVAATCCRLLSEARSPVAAGFRGELDECRETSYRLTDEEGSSPEQLGQLVAARAWSLDLATRTAQAVIASAGGQAMHKSHPGQRLLREAAFYTVQAQTAALRSDSINRLVRRHSIT
jgi:alkylation response protein AidB-like acyl-CoA dehydrogenase